MEHFTVTQFDSAMIVHDRAGSKKSFSNRRTACFIIPQTGRICFTHESGTVTAHAAQPVFLPKGLNYINECIEDAESYVFNFQTLENDLTPTALTPIPSVAADEFYDLTQSEPLTPTLLTTLRIMEAIYSLSHRLLARFGPQKALHPAVEHALRYLQQNCHRSDLTLKQVARNACISEVYLRKLFVKELKCPPFQKLTELRMQKARLLIEEKHPLKEVAEQVGYSDVFQFSRAYKRHFGYPPSRT